MSYAGAINHQECDMSAVNATPENLSDILSGTDIARVPQRCPETAHALP